MLKFVDDINSLVSGVKIKTNALDSMWQRWQSSCSQKRRSVIGNFYLPSSVVKRRKIMYNTSSKVQYLQWLLFRTILYFQLGIEIQKVQVAKTFNFTEVHFLMHFRVRFLVCFARRKINLMMTDTKKFPVDEFNFFYHSTVPIDNRFALLYIVLSWMLKE